MILFVCLLLELLSGMEVDLFVPSFPLIQECFSLTPFLVELTLGINLVAYCLASFIASPLSEYFGKKTTVIIGCLIFILGSFACSFAPSYFWVLSGRFLQGLGIAMPCVLAYVIITDHYTKEQQTRFLGYMNAAITLGMAIAPIIGSFVAFKYGWCGNFHVLTLFGIVAFLSVVFLLPKDQSKKENKPFFSSFKPVLTDHVSWLLMSSMVLMFLGYWSFIALSPILYIEVYKIDMIHFGYYQGALTFVFAIGSILGGRFIERVGEENSLKYSLYLLFISGIFVVICILFELSPLWITTSLCLHTLGTALPVMILWPLFMNIDNVFKTQRSSIITALRLILTAVIVQLISFLYDGTFLYIGCFIASVSFLSYPLSMHAYRKAISLKDHKSVSSSS